MGTYHATVNGRSQVSVSAGRRAQAFRLSARLGQIRYALRGPLPADVRDEEITEIALFRASLTLNLITGGSAGMTFSARCHRARSTAPSKAAWGFWILLEGSIDLSCAAMRGERAHCATAWVNHNARNWPGTGKFGPGPAELDLGFVAEEPV